ncbi:hydroxymethylpyrimidine/phosphomethylpyrimidine kinase [Ectothiorhodospiraceae bacterium 2226]|nr:hydroxymethylpyrimidine/phosphomethylpyrimidine kinase [Ectothiorhodospiraceae bacterium 2226]
MTQHHARVPAVMSFAGNDPTGGAGIQADIETIISMGCHAAPVITALTVQDTRNVVEVRPVDAALVVEQARAVLLDVPIACFKIGLIGSAENASAIHTLLLDHPEIPVVFDPVLAAGGGRPLADDVLMDAITALLLPLTTILTPNSLEARRLAPEADTLDACAQELQATGCEFVLITGTHERGDPVVNTFYGNHRRLESFQWDRLPHSYHGSGCTLASAIAGLLAQGLEPLAAVHEAQEYTYRTLEHAYAAGQGQLLPNRLFWARGDEEAGDGEP